MVTMFIDSLQSPFYDRMIGSVSSNFSDVVIMRESIEGGIRMEKFLMIQLEHLMQKSP